jgi:anti-anti-sigma factor
MGIAEVLVPYNSRHAEAPVTVKSEDPARLVLGLSGELDMKASNDLAPLLETALDLCPEGSRFVLDISKVGYVASMGVGLLANLLVSAERRRVSFALLDIPPRVRTIMDALGLLSYFHEERSPVAGGSR